ncbi:hypothetical protein M1349_01330 [Patescibacteria group bacterium]|nr:hypothetical protein [Patescibacteria group bacterium]
MERDSKRGICLTGNGSPAAIYGVHGCDSLGLTEKGLTCEKGLDIKLINSVGGSCVRASVHGIPGTASAKGFEPRVDTAG